MTGIQLSQYNPKGAAYTPAASPIAFLKREKIADDEIGHFFPEQPLYDSYKQALTQAVNDVVFALPMP